VAADVAIGLATLALAVGLSVWGRGALRWACVLIAMAAGTALAAALGRLHPGGDLDLAAMPLVGLPALGSIGLAFDAALLPAFLVAALAVEVVPQVAGWVPEGLRPLMTAGALGTLVALVLNALLRIGIRRQMAVTHAAAAMTGEAMAAFLERAGGAWGLRAELVSRTVHALTWCMEAILVADLARGPVTLTVGYDEARVDVRLTYAGLGVTLAERAPTADELLRDDDAPGRLAGHMIRRLTDRVAVRERDGVVELRMVLND
jgi:hypothetical protein